jgi:hypothetical protein
MAIMTSNFWMAMSAGRILWAVLSGLVSTAWPILVANTAVCLASSLCFLMCESRVVLWAAAVGTGLGVSSTFPAALTLPPEYGVNPTARLVMGLQFAASAGEMSLPFVMGVFFQWERCAHPARTLAAPYPTFRPPLPPLRHR